VSNAREAREAIAESGWPDLYAIEFVDLRKEQGWYRKLRAMCMGDQTVIFHGGCYSEWLVTGGFRNPEGIAFYRAHPESVEHLCAILNDPEGELGGGCLEALRQIRERIPLDIFGIDFDVDDAGQVVLFEATPGMVIQHPRARKPPDLWLPMEPFERVHAAFHHLVARRISERATKPGDRGEEATEGSPSDEHRSANHSWPPVLRPVRSIGDYGGSNLARRAMTPRKVIIALVLLLFALIRLFTSLAGSWH